MELPESIEHLNNLLISEYGRVENYPRYRVVFSDTETEDRWVTHTREGMQLINPRVEKRWKYKHYIQGRYILERFLDIPFGMSTDLVEKFSYEPVWVFQDRQGEYLPPRWYPIKYLIDHLHEQSKKAIGVKYKEEGDDPKIAREVQEAKIKRLEEELFGDESEVADALHYREGIVVPGVNDGNSGISRSIESSEEKNDKGAS